VTFVCKYVALFVHDLRSAETFYRRVFDMELLFRESRRGNDWYALRPGAVRASVPESVTQGISPLGLRFEDPFGFAWVVREPATAFRSSGEIAGRWLD
jgi:catechol 2,3-dioxygenase-like lactoylglutathione lyase family enzyme